MVKKSKAGSEKKKKGPKGKKARAKAKLERQWGEETKDDMPSTKRVGRSRLKARLRVGGAKSPIVKTSDDSDPKNIRAGDALMPKKVDSDDDSEEEENEDLALANGGTYSRLLQTIGGKKTQIADFESEDEHDMEVENSDAKNEPPPDVSEEDESDDEKVDDVFPFNPFELRFAKPPLPEDDSKREVIVQRLKKTKKITVPHVHPMLELHVSEPLLEETTVDAEKMTKNDWKKLNKRSFLCNKDDLRRYWQESQKRALSPWQSVLYPFVTRYADCLIVCNSARKREEASKMALLHIVNHVLTSRGRVQHQNRRIKAIEAAHNPDNNQEEEGVAFKDQGYTRPTLLVLLPTRGTCHKFLLQLLLLVGGGNIPEEYMDRFEREYGPPPTDEEGDDAMRRRRKRVLEEKGAAWQELFGDDVNDDDDFKIGIALSVKAAADGKKNTKSKTQDKSGSGVNAKLYTDFYSSDIIVASPLGLRMAMLSDSNQRDSDFLSSIEICLMWRSDVMMMQNWDHVNEVLEGLNQLPSKNNETDFARVRDYFLVNQAAHWRQLIMLTDILDPAIASSFKRFAKSNSGQLKTRQQISEEEGSISNVILPIGQVFQRIPAKSIGSMSEDRMKYMVEKILPPILQKVQKHTLIYTPSYFDFVLIRNHLIKKEAQFVSVTEYSRVSETSRGRARFLQGHKPLMLFTGRAQFFLRHKIKGIRHLIFFGLPEHPEFYSDLVNVINDGLEEDYDTSSRGDAATSMALFTKYEAHSLERIVGTGQSNQMIKGEKSTFMFVS